MRYIPSTLFLCNNATNPLVSTKVLKILKTYPLASTLNLTTLILSYLFFAILLYISFYFRTFASRMNIAAVMLCTTNQELLTIKYNHYGKNYSRFSKNFNYKVSHRLE